MLNIYVFANPPAGEAGKESRVLGMAISF